MFEAIHGSAPRRAGQNLANPSGLLQGAVMMLNHIGKSEVAEKVQNAWLKTIEDGIHTYDIYKEGLSKEKVEELVDELKMQDVYNIEYELGRYKYAKGGGVDEINEIRLIADINHPHTRNVLKQKWESASYELQEKMLDKIGFSSKYAGMKFDDLTQAIQERLVWFDVYDKGGNIVELSQKAKIAEIRLIADINHPHTRNILKQKWENVSYEKQKQMLDKIGFSSKYAGMKFDDLTPAIQERLVWF
jgi:hypothetical protein